MFLSIGVLFRIFDEFEEVSAALARAFGFLTSVRKIATFQPHPRAIEDRQNAFFTECASKSLKTCHNFFFDLKDEKRLDAF